MDASLLTPSNIMFGLGIIGIIFSIYHYFRTPQIKAEKTDALLSQRVQWDRESIDKKTEELSKRLDSSMTLAQNHIHTVDVKVDNLSQMVNQMNLTLTGEITKLSTIIDERIPRK